VAEQFYPLGVWQQKSRLRGCDCTNHRNPSFNPIDPWSKLLSVRGSTQMAHRHHDTSTDETISPLGSLVEELVRPELDWRSPPPFPTMINRQSLRVAVSRWRVASRHRVEVVSDANNDYHVLSIALRRTRKELFICEKSVWRGAAPDAMLLTGPKRGKWRAIIDGGCDFLRIFLPQSLIAECYIEAFGTAPSGSISLFELLSVEDKRLRQLGQTFKALDGYDPVVAPCLADSLGLAFASRLVELAYEPRETSKKCKLARSQISRIMDHIEDNIARALCLSELSEVAGVSRVQLARQFRQATGRSPHAYILWRRIEHAKKLLNGSDSTIIGVALDLGFCSQAHFTQVFKRIVGVTPRRWRRSQD
jgi:AraC family transcriptional regulator